MLQQTEKSGLYEELVKHNKKQVYPMHMPGHKRNLEIMSMASPYSIDITEIDGFDNMHNPSGLIKDIIDEANELYGAKRTWLSVNGSSIGIMASICAVANRGDTILISRNSHKSVYNAIELMELTPEYIFPEYIGDGINGQVFLTDIIQKIEKNSKICAVVVTNPTYEGITSDIEAISSYLHTKGVILIVDSAHGAHLGFHDGFPRNSIELGADIVIHSIHKTMPAFTQTSLIHLVSDKLVDETRLNKYISMFQSSSPSYILMAGIENCIKVVRKYPNIFEEFNRNLEEFYEGASKLKNIYVLDYKKDGVVWRDKSKIVIISKCEDINKYGGSYIYDKLLKEYKVQLEMKSATYCLAMTSICDTKEGLDKLLIALVNIDNELSQIRYKNRGKIVGNLVDNVDKFSVEKPCIIRNQDQFTIAMKVYSQYPPYKIQKLLITRTKILDSVDKVSAEYVYLYPPDIPLIVPGEKITKEFVDRILDYKDMGLSVEGLEDKSLEYIKVVMED